MNVKNKNASLLLKFEENHIYPVVVCFLRTANKLISCSICSRVFIQHMAFQFKLKELTLKKLTQSGVGHKYIIEVDCSWDQFKSYKLKDKEYSINAPIFFTSLQKKMDAPNF